MNKHNYGKGVSYTPGRTRIHIPMNNPTATRIPRFNQFPQPHIPHLLILLFAAHFRGRFHRNSFEIIPIYIFRCIPIFFIEQHYVSVPLPNPIIGPCFFMKPDTNVVFTNCNSLTRVGFKGLDIAGENYSYDLLLELRFLLCELGFGIVVVVIVRGEMGGDGGIEEKVF